MHREIGGSIVASPTRCVAVQFNYTIGYRFSDPAPRIGRPIHEARLQSYFPKLYRICRESTLGAPYNAEKYPLPADEPKEP